MISQGTIWGEELQVWSLHLNEQWCWFRTLYPVIACLKQNAAQEQKFPIFPVCLLRTDIYTDTVHFYQLGKICCLFIIMQIRNHLFFNVRCDSRQVVCSLYQGSWSPTALSASRQGWKHSLFLHSLLPGLHGRPSPSNRAEVTGLFLSEPTSLSLSVLCCLYVS